MRCNHCGFENPEGMKFCGGCGSGLLLRCPSCGFENQPSFRFCGGCGTALGGAAHGGPARPAPPAPGPPSAPPDRASAAEPSRPAAGPEPLAPPPASAGERRQLTVVFVDLVGSARLSERLDPEDLRRLLREYQAAAARVIKRFEGHVAQYLGDGMLVYFGFPTAHEDDAVRAVRAGLAIAEAVQRIQVPTGADRLAVRVGIHTGLVVVGADEDDAGRDALAIGQTPNVAARLQEIGEAGSVVVSAATHRLVERFFEFGDLGERELKGISQPLRVYRILHESAARARVEGSAAEPPHLVGRQRELDFLLGRWEQVREGAGQVILLSGDAGIGKSRLVEAFKARVAAGADAWLTECRCSAHHRNTAFHPIIELLQRVVLGFERGDTPEAKLDKIEGFLVQYGQPLADTAPLLAGLLSVPLGDRHPPPDLSPDRQRQRTIEVLLSILLDRAARQPVLFLVEDLHWADPSTLELLDQLLDQVPGANLLAVLTHRPNFDPPWGARSYLSQLAVAPLAARDAAALVAHLTGGRALPPEVLDRIVERTDGVPLFVEEVTRMVLESGMLRRENGHYILTGPLPLLPIPATLQDSLTARLDRLSAAKTVAQLAAALGREFSYDLIRAVWPGEEDSLREGLSRLVDAEILVRRLLPPRATYIFRHALLQEAAYESLLRSTRQQYHFRIARVLEERFPEIAEAEPETLAHHYTEAGDADRAVGFWQTAGQRAFQRSALREAAAHLTRGLELLRAFPDADSPERMQLELPFQLTLGMASIALRGYAAPEVESAFLRAKELCRALGGGTPLFPVLWGLWAFHIVRGEFGPARELGDELQALAEAENDPDLLLEAHAAQGLNAYYPAGDLASARDHFQTAAGIYDPEKHGAHAAVYAQDPGMVAHAHLGWVLLLLGSPADGAAAADRSVEIARRIGHPYSQAYALVFRGVFHQLRGDPDATRAAAEEARALSEEHGFPIWLADSFILRGWARARLGDADEGIAELRQGIETWIAIGASLWLTQAHALLADACLAAGRHEEGLAALDRAEAILEDTGERYYQAELFRLRGRLLLAGGADADEGRAWFRRALDRAREQGAALWELRAALELARLAPDGHLPDDLRALVAGPLARFPDDAELPDVAEARALAAGP